MKEHVNRLIVVLAVTGLLSACGGGGSGSPAAPAATTSSKTVSGTVVSTSSSGGVGKAASADTIAISDGVAIQIVSFDLNNTELGRAAVTSDANGGYTAQLPLWSAGGYVLITATKEGYTDFQKRIDYTTPADLELQAALDRIAFTKEITVDSNGAVVGKSAEPSFNFAVISYANGTRKAVAGKSAIMAAKSAADATLEMGISIPASSLAGVTSISAQASTFDPATNQLPGSYTATDPTGKEGKMISLAFDYLDLKANTADGPKNLGKVAKALVKAGVKKAADKTTTYTRHIYTNSCENLFIEDYNTTLAGHQVPVWSLNPNTGKWVYIGEGTVSDSNGTTLSSPTKTACGGGNYYLTIQVANTEFQNNYWNLDHIVFDTPTKVCVSGTFADTSGKALANLGISLNGKNFDNSWGKTGSDGKYTLETVLLNKNSTERGGTLYFFDADGSYQSQAVTLDAAYPTCKTFDKKDFPVPCEVSGKMVNDAGAGVAYRNLSLVGTSGFYKGVGTDGTGAFASKVKCGENIKVYSGTSTALATFNVNNSQETSETSDDGTTVVLNNITAPNMAPTGYGYFASRSINVKNTSALKAYLSGYDQDNDYPLAYKITVGGVVKTGTIDTTTSQPVEVAFANFTTVGEYAASYELTDNKGAKSTIDLGMVYVSDGSRAPLVQLSASNNYVRACSSTRTVTLYGWANDPEGDAMTATWGTSAGCTPVTSSAGAALSAACPVTLPQGNGPFTYDISVSDGTSAKQASTVIRTYNNKPVVSISADKQLVVSGATGAERTVTLTATATDPDGDTVSAGTWAVNGTALTSCTGTTCAYTIPDSATTGQIFEFTYGAADCAATGSGTKSIVYGQAADVNIVVQ